MDNKEKDEVKKARELIERFDPALVAIAMQEINIRSQDVERAKEGIRNVYDSIATEPHQHKSRVLSKAMAEVRTEVINQEIDKVKEALEGIDRMALLIAMDEAGYYHTIPVEGPICRYTLPVPIPCPISLPIPCYRNLPCPEHCIQFMHVEYCFDPIGPCGFCVQVMQVLDRTDKVGVVLRDDRIAGGIVTEIKPVMDAIMPERRRLYAGLCEYPVDCTGKQIYVMAKCKSSLIPLDIGGAIDPIDAILKVAESNPALHKRIRNMVEKMKDVGE
jgi:hypothetical protein